ncbi:MAG: phage integrase SAM-like domain-containing protein, partial [Planctomycetota bacterium]|nr:phage integrase SAM-like domain-containing protein [Planctomycetota bacterium]
MASLQKLSGGKRPIRAIDFTDSRDGKRKRIRLGKVSHDDALEYKRWIERLISAKLLAHPDIKANEWLSERVPDQIHERIANVGLCTSRTRPSEFPTLRAWIDRYLSERSDLKPASRKRIELTADRLIQYFGSDILIGDITPSMAHEWRATLYTPIRGKSRLSEASVRTHCRNAKAMFTAAVERELIPRNPFTGLKSASIAANRDHYITPAQTRDILAVAPPAWRVLIGLARFSGLRVPSETHLLKWSSVDFERKQLIAVYAPKTDSYRTVPIVPELLTILADAYAIAAGSPDAVPSPTSAVVTVPRHNRHRMMKLILERAGIKPWGDLFQTLRRSAETDFARENPQHAVSSWIGHSMQVSERNYLMMTNDLIDAASSRPLMSESKSASKSSSKSASVKPGIVMQHDAIVHNANVP